MKKTTAAQHHPIKVTLWDVTDKKIEVLDSEAPAAVLEAVRNEIKNHPCYNSNLMSEVEQEKLNYYKEGIQQSQMHGLHTISDSRLHISGGLNDYAGIERIVRENGTSCNSKCWR